MSLYRTLRLIFKAGACGAKWYPARSTRVQRIPVATEASPTGIRKEPRDTSISRIK